MTGRNEATAHRREFIKFALRVRGSSLAEVSRELGVSQPVVSQVCAGERVSQRIREAIADKLNRRPDELWPGSGQGGEMTA